MTRNDRQDLMGTIRKESNPSDTINTTPLSLKAARGSSRIRPLATGRCPNNKLSPNMLNGQIDQQRPEHVGGLGCVDMCLEKVSLGVDIELVDDGYNALVDWIERRAEERALDCGDDVKYERIEGGAGCNTKVFGVEDERATVGGVEDVVATASEGGLLGSFEERHQIFVRRRGEGDDRFVGCDEKFEGFADGDVPSCVVRPFGECDGFAEWAEACVRG